MPVAPYRKAAFAVVLLAIGLFCCGMFRVSSQSAHHAYSASGRPPSTVKLTAGTQYILSVHGGIKSLLNRGIDIASPNCTWSVGGTEAQALTVSPAGTSAKGTNAVATFIAPFTGNLHIECKDFGGVYVDNSDDAQSDVAGWYLFAGVIALTVGAGLGTSAMRDASLRRSRQGTASHHDEVETFVDVAHGGVEDDEIGGRDRRDVLS